MLTVRDLIPGIRDWLGKPDKGKLSNTTILLRMFDELDNFRSSMNLANVGWSLMHTDIAVQAGQEEIPVEGQIPLGGVVLVTTWDGSDTGFTAEEVPVTTIQSQDKYYVGPRVEDNYNSAEGHAVRVFTFTRDAQTGNVIAIVKPSHQQLAYYRIWHQIDRAEQPALNDMLPFLQAFANLLKIKVAIACLMELYEEREVADKVVTNMAQLKLRMEILAKKEAEFGAIFEKTKQQPIPQQSGSRVGFSRYYDDGIGSDY